MTPSGNIGADGVAIFESVSLGREFCFHCRRSDKTSRLNLQGCDTRSKIQVCVSTLLPTCFRLTVSTGNSREFKI